ncbi:MAG: SIS domain-containing protein [Spirochaetia bacterium]|jgi:D-sedoheptulose 7-phosphate isomerase
MNDDARTHISGLFEQQTELIPCRSALEAAFEALKSCFQAGNKLLICGNGGSAADTEHIVGELMKGFRSRRSLPEAELAKLRTLYGSDGEEIARRLQGALPAISLVSQISLATAVTNDVSADMVFAQQVFGYGRPGDALIAISTSGNAANVINAVKVARALDLKTIALTGLGGTLKELVEISISAPGGDTSRIQEYHMAIYHSLCAALEAELFPG